MFQFAHPWMFAFLGLIPFFLVLLWGQKAEKGLPFPTVAWLPSAKVALWIPGILYLLGYLLLVFALARPQLHYTRVTTEVEGIDIVLAIDNSNSMLAEDLSPNRMAVAKSVVAEFIETQQNNRIAVVVFAGASFTLMPLTLDYALLAEAVRGIYLEMVEIPGTAIGDSILNALNRFRSEDKTVSRVIILLSDGVNDSGADPLFAAQLAREKGVKIYTIGIGQTRPIPVRIRRLDGKYVYLRNQKGGLYFAQYNPQDLKAIAQAANGRYFHAENKEELTEIYREIDRLEKSQFEQTRQTEKKEVMHWFLWPALFIFMLYIFLRTRVWPLMD